MDNISVIIRNKNEEQYIGFAIQSVLNFYPNAEIVIVDNNSTDSSLQIAKMFDFSNMKIINMDGYSPGKSINLGVSHCSNEIILILSAHCKIIEPIINIKSELEKYDAVFGHQKPIYKGKEITPRYIWSHFGKDLVENLYSKIENRQFLHNAFCYYKKSILEKRPFDENLAGKEDRYWAIDLVKDKRKYLYNPLGKVEHYFTNNGSTWRNLG